jgi:hypothetical protein
MKKYLLGLIVGLILIVPFKVEATDYNYDLCSEDTCVYKDFDSVFTAINNTELESNDNININVGEGNFNCGRVSEVPSSVNMTINGTGTSTSKINMIGSFPMLWGLNNLKISNISFYGDNYTFGFMPPFVFLTTKFEMNNVDFSNFKMTDNMRRMEGIGLINLSYTGTAIFKDITIKDVDYPSAIQIVVYSGRMAPISQTISNISNFAYSFDNLDISGSSKAIDIINSITDDSILPITVSITNSNLDTGFCSIEADSYYIYSSSFGTTNPRQTNNIINKRVTYLPVDTSNIDYVNITNSKLTGLKANSVMRTDESEATVTTPKLVNSRVSPVIYADFSNTWLVEPTKNFNLVEIGKSKIYMDNIIKKDVSMAVNANTNLGDIIPSSELTDITYEVEDETVARIVDNKVVGLKTGTTKIVARSGLNVYQFSVSIIKNPVTSVGFMVFVMLFALVSLATVVTYTFKLEKQDNL